MCTERGPGCLVAHIDLQTHPHAGKDPEEDSLKHRLLSALGIDDSDASEDMDNPAFEEDPLSVDEVDIAESTILKCLLAWWLVL